MHLQNEIIYQKEVGINKKDKLSSNESPLLAFFDNIISFLCIEARHIKLCLKLTNNTKGSPTEISVENQLQWTAQKIDLVELIYALYYSNSFNHGNVEIKDIIESFEQFFGISLGKYYRTYFDVTRRKKIRAKFVQELLTLLEEKFFELDGK
ncbi:MAG: RteC domain-containing protein [Draconibacterium sp.]